MVYYFYLLNLSHHFLNLSKNLLMNTNSMLVIFGKYWTNKVLTRQRQNACCLPNSFRKARVNICWLWLRRFYQLFVFRNRRHRKKRCRSITIAMITMTTINPLGVRPAKSFLVAARPPCMVVYS